MENFINFNCENESLDFSNLYNDLISEKQVEKNCTSCKTKNNSHSHTMNLDFENTQFVILRINRYYNQIIEESKKKIIRKKK